MANSYAESKRMPLGEGDLYINNIWVGSLKGKVIFHDKVTYAEQFPGNLLSPVKAERIKQEVTMEAEVCDFKIAQLRRAIGVNEAVDTTTAVQIRKKEQLKLSGTANIATAKTMVAASLKVSKMDRSTAYLSGTDYSATSTTIARKSGGTITAAQIVMVEYDFSDSAPASQLVGGEQTTPNTFELDFVHDLSDGKILQITIFKAFSMTDFSWLFSEKSSGNFSTYNVTFKALVDLTKKEGQNLYRITEETGSATIN